MWIMPMDIVHKSVKDNTCAEKRSFHFLRRNPIMMITVDKNGPALKLTLSGRLDTTTAPELEKVIEAQTDGVTELELDMEKLEYISSAGLRVLLAATKQMDAAGGTLTVSHVCEDVMEVFDMTGFSDILNIK